MLTLINMIVILYHAADKLRLVFVKLNNIVVAKFKKIKITGELQ
jgi:hypothetical protein